MLIRLGGVIPSHNPHCMGRGGLSVISLYSGLSIPGLAGDGSPAKGRQVERGTCQYVTCRTPAHAALWFPAEPSRRSIASRIAALTMPF